MAQILLVDDDDLLRNAIQYMLSSAGYDVVEAQNGAEALQQAKSIMPDLVITDINMPIMDGFELMQELCSVTPEQAIIAMTATTGISTDDDRHISRAMSSGAREIIFKPFDVDYFLSRVAVSVNV
ncbi:PleD family two-component system response regulator [Pseudomonadota bacterium]